MAHTLPTPLPVRATRRGALPPFERLEGTHHRMMLTLQNLETLVRRLETEGVDETAQTLAGGIHRFFEEVGRTHHDEEERHIFPVLLASGDALLAEQVAQLRQDHGWIEQNWRELSPLLDALSQGHTWVDVDLLRAMIEVFTQLHHEHIALEESMVYPEARRREAEARNQTAQRRAHWAQEAA